jgi:hypothetical protein
MACGMSIACRSVKEATRQDPCQSKDSHRVWPTGPILGWPPQCPAPTNSITPSPACKYPHLLVHIAAHMSASTQAQTNTHTHTPTHTHTQDCDCLTQLCAGRESSENTRILTQNFACTHDAKVAHTFFACINISAACSFSALVSAQIDTGIAMRVGIDSLRRRAPRRRCTARTDPPALSRMLVSLMEPRDNVSFARGHAWRENAQSFILTLTKCVQLPCCYT